MKLQTFENTILELRDLYNSAVNHDRKLEDALGGDTQVATLWWDDFITNSLHILERDMSDTKDIIGWLFWDSMDDSTGYNTFTDNDEEYEGSPKNVWLSLKGKLPRKDEQEAFDYNKPGTWFAPLSVNQVPGLL